MAPLFSLSRKPAFASVGSSLLFLMGTIGPSCGIKGDPVPPSLVVPRAIQDLTAISRPEAIFLIWSIPQKNIDSSLLRNLKGFYVYRFQENLSSPSGVPDPGRMEKIASVDYEYPSNARIQGRQVIFSDPDISPGNRYYYVVHSFTLGGYSSPPSNFARTDRADHPGPPIHVQGTIGDRWISLSWSPPETSDPARESPPITGYNIFRSENKEDFPFFPINPEPITTTRHTDLGLENNREYYYRVSSISSFHGSLIEGTSSSTLSLVPQDTTPPLPPRGLSAVPTASGIELQWEPNSDPDLLGYLVYRGKGPGSDSQLLTPEPITPNRYRDPSARPGTPYRYRVSAVDRSPARNESEPSEPVPARIPR